MSAVRYREVLRQPEFTALYVADILSISCSYLAQIAVAALVYYRTGSTTYTAVAFAISYAPFLFSPWLSTFADLWPRRGLLIVCDLARAACIGAIVIPGAPTGLILALLFVEALFRVPWGAARLALLSEILTEELIPAGNALVSSTRQALQVGGFGLGGVVVALVGSRPALALDAVTYALSAAIIALAIRPRPAPWVQDGPAASTSNDVQGGPAAVAVGVSAARPTAWDSMVLGLKTCAQTHRMPQLLMLMALGPAVVVITEGLAVPFADELGGAVPLAGVIMAAPPLGNVVGLFLFGRLPSERQRFLVGPLACGSAMAIACAGAVGLLLHWTVGTVALLALAGACLCYLNAIQTEIATSIEPRVRGRVFGLANAVLQLSQGGAILIGGVVAASLSVAGALVGLALVGTAAIVAVVVHIPAAQTVAERMDRPSA